MTQLRSIPIHPGMNRYIFLIVITVLVPAVKLDAGDETERAEGKKKIEQAVAQTNIFELSSFQMKASVQIESQGKQIDGSYQMLWAGHERWREEINLPGYKEIQVGGNGKVWVQRSTDFMPLRIYNLHAVLGFGSGAGVGHRYAESLVQSGLIEKDVPRKMHSRKQHGERLSCVEIENERKTSREICVNDVTGTIVRNPSYVDKDFQPAGTKIFPRHLRFVVGGRTVAKVDVSELVTPAQISPEAFDPPQGAVPQNGCMNPMPFRIDNRIPPEYPPRARASHVQGTVAVDVWIEADGTPQIGEVVARADSDLEKSTIEAIQRWHYEPAKCNGVPVNVETVVQINYALSP